MILAKSEMALNMVSEGIALETTSRITGLSIEEIELLRAEG